MKSLKMKDGDIQLGEKVTGMEEFLQRWMNSLKIYSNESVSYTHLTLPTT